MFEGRDATAHLDAARDQLRAERKAVALKHLAYRIAHERARNQADIEADPPPF
jgi:hypothetical protein